MRRITGYFDIFKNLKTSKRRFFRDSKLYSEITGLLDSFTSQMEQKVTVDSAAKLFETERKLKEKVEEYLAKRKNPHTSVGKARYEMMQELASFNGASEVLRDVTKIKDYEKDGKKLIEVVSMARNSTVVDITDREKKVFGAGASERIRFEHNGRRGFFTASETVPNVKEVAKIEVARFVSEHRELASRPGVMKMIEGATYGGMLDGTTKAHAFGTLVEFSEGKAKVSDFREEEISALGGFYLKMSKINNQPLVAANAGIDAQSEISIRNVATSRVARMMQVDDKIAFTEVMTVKNGDKEIKGSFMEAARGIDSRSEPGLRFFAENKADLTSAAFQRDLNRIQVLDMLCGQIDRHAGNMFYHLDRNNAVIGLQGIDNDLAFGKIDLSSDAACLTSASSLNIIDREMYDCLKAYTPEKIRYSMGDILSEDEVNAMITRREQIIERVELPGGARIVETNEWGPNTLVETRESKYYKEVEKELTNAEACLAAQKATAVKEYDEAVTRVTEYNKLHPDMLQELPQKPEFYDEVKPPVRHEVSLDSLSGASNAKTHIDGKKAPTHDMAKEASSSLQHTPPVKAHN